MGAVCCRVEEDHKLYIMTLGVLAPYRRLGVGKPFLNAVDVCLPTKWFAGKLMMDHVLADMIKCQKDVNQVYVHVQVSMIWFQNVVCRSNVVLNVLKQVNNDGAIAFYKQFGFENTGTIENYYKRITPNNCYVLTKKLSSIEPDIKG